MTLKVVLRRVPVRVSAAIAATAISAAINAYSIALTPSRSCSNLSSMHMQKPFGKAPDQIIVNPED